MSNPTVPMKPETVQRLNLVYNSDRENCTCQTKRPFKPVMTTSVLPRSSPSREVRENQVSFAKNKYSAGKLCEVEHEYRI